MPHPRHGTVLILLASMLVAGHLSAAVSLPTVSLTRDEPGPFLQIGPPGAEDSNKTGPRVVLRLGSGDYRMWYEAVPGANRASVGYASVYAPSEGMGKAVAYFLRRWDDFKRYTLSGSLPIDNNAAERSIRGVVIGRKNWYFAGSEDAAGWAAIMHTLIESCRLQGLDPRAYLSQVVKLLHRDPKANPAALTPRALAPQLKIP